MDYLKIVIEPLDASLAESTNEIVLALIEDAPFDSFVETPTGLEAFMPKPLWSSDTENLLNDLKTQLDLTWESTEIPHQNWNAVWESNFEPIRVGDFVGIRADFHPKTEGVQFDLCINPKMAFGTGHHETTHMMIQSMENMDFQGKKVLDYGCGTGVLAIVAAKLGATDIEAVDIEQPSYESTIENAELNETPQIKAFFGTLEAIPSTDFDVVLANINRNILVETLPDLQHRTNTGGVILLSGFMPQDVEIIENAAKNAQFTPQNTLQRGNWICMKCVRN